MKNFNNKNNENLLKQRRKNIYNRKQKNKNQEKVWEQIS